ncbi:MAG: hypothetical protein EPO02_11295 [Nitrospirae bacterium]|nr:MAG: hypothetical protein EPO02_11295 [Nitrospirota bacterium]
MPKKRGLFRISIHRTGELRRGADVVPCEVVELTEKGFGLESSLRVATGEAVELRFDLTDKWPIQCTIQVSHAAPPRLGGNITAISPEHQESLTRFIDQHTTINLPGV